MERNITVEANHLEAISINYSAGPATIGSALEKVQEFLDCVLIEAIHSRELRNGTNGARQFGDIVGALGALSQMLKGSSGIAGVQMAPGQMRQ